MAEGINKDGRTMVIVGHNPTHNWKLAENPGIAAVVLAHIANAPLTSATLDIDSRNPVAQSTGTWTDTWSRIKNFIKLKRPNSRIIFGEPINLAEIPGR